MRESAEIGVKANSAATRERRARRGCPPTGPRVAPEAEMVAIDTEKEDNSIYGVVNHLEGVVRGHQPGELRWGAVAGGTITGCAQEDIEAAG